MLPKSQLKQIRSLILLTDGVTVGLVLVWWYFAH